MQMNENDAWYGLRYRMNELSKKPNTARWEMYNKRVMFILLTNLCEIIWLYLIEKHSNNFSHD